MASPTSSSARPLPYISAVSMWVMPRSRPARRVSMAWRSVSRGPSIIQVPCPMTGTWTPVHPNSRFGIAITEAYYELEREAEGELHAPREVLLGDGGAAEVIRCQAGVGTLINRGIEGVEGLGAELEVDALADLEVLEHRHIDLGGPHVADVREAV